MLSRESILAAKEHFPREEIDLPELAGSVFVRSMSAGQRDRLENAFLKSPGIHVRARVAAYCLCDEAGNLLFTEADLPDLSDLPASVLDRVYEAGLRLSRLTGRDREDLEKNSETGRNGDSSSGSLATSAAASPSWNGS